MKNTVKYVEWDDKFSVGIPLVDNQHKRLVEMTNMLHEACILNSEAALIQFNETASEMVLYVNQHFTTEEQLMERTNFPGLAEHKKMHAEFVKELLTDVEAVKSGKKLIPNNFVKFLRDWVLSHIAIYDSKLGAYLAEQKKKSG